MNQELTNEMIVSVKEMKEIERKADESGLSYYQMMENAGRQSYCILKEEYPDVEAVSVFCGKGNNGGDGLVVARHAAKDNKKVYVVLAEGEPVTEDARTNYEKLPESVKIYKIEDFDENVLLKNNHKLVVVDALYGTGFHGELRESGRKACDLVNSLGHPVIALDIPSGCNADSREISSGAVKADITVAFHAYKNIHVPAVKNCGKCMLASIGINE